MSINQRGYGQILRAKTRQIDNGNAVRCERVSSRVSEGFAKRQIRLRVNDPGPNLVPELAVMQALIMVIRVNEIRQTQNFRMEFLFAGTVGAYGDDMMSRPYILRRNQGCCRRRCRQNNPALRAKLGNGSRTFYNGRGHL